MSNSLKSALLAMPQLDYLRWCKWRFGWKWALVNALTNLWPLLRGGGALVKVRAPGRKPGVRLRPGGMDQGVYEQVFVQDQYVLDIAPPRVIIDAGAHIGLAAVYFAEKYPEATIISLEPEGRNFDLLRKNTARYPNVHPVRAGLWSRAANLKIENEGVASWSFRVLEAAPGEGGIPALGITDLISRFGLSRIDLLKIDVEGSEIEVLGTSGEWLDKVQTLVIELHDRFRPGCRAALDHAVSGRGFTESVAGENVVFSRRAG
jgi:FkbM family methyltransferase